MRLNVHLIMGLNEDSIGPANYLQNRNEVVFIVDHTVKGVNKRKDFTLVDQAFVDLIDHTLFKVYVYEPPYKKGRILHGTRSLVIGKRVDRKSD